jgi:hypothetical protein
MNVMVPLGAVFSAGLANLKIFKTEFGGKTVFHRFQD